MENGLKKTLLSDENVITWVVKNSKGVRLGNFMCRRDAEEYVDSLHYSQDFHFDGFYVDEEISGLGSI